MNRFTAELALKRWRWFESSRVEIDCDGLFKRPLASLSSESLPHQTTGVVRSWQQSDNQRFYIFDHPRPLRDGNGRPYIQLLDAADMGLLQMRVEWRMFESCGGVVHKQIGADGTVHFASSSQMRLLPLIVEKVELLLRSASGDKILATAPASTKLPCTAIFSVYLNEIEKNLISAALRQRTGLLFVRCYAKQQIVSGATVLTTFFCESDVATWFAKGEGAVCIRPL